MSYTSIREVDGVFFGGRMRRVCGVLAAVIATLSWSTGAGAATANSTKGALSINGGDPINGSVTVKVGDAVSACGNCEGAIVYANGCVAKVEPNTTVTVVHDDHCSLGAASLSGSTLAIGGLAVAGAIGLGIAAGRGKDHKPASP